MTPDAAANSAELRQEPGVASSWRDSVLQHGQTGIAATLGGTAPIFLEGCLSRARYDPLAVFTAGAKQSRFVRWNNLTATAGFGYGIRLTDTLPLRPTLNASLGYAVSDTAILGWLIRDRVGIEFPFFAERQVFAHGLGGSLMLAYSDWRPERETGVELRYTRLRLETFGGSFAPALGSMTSETLGLWSRHRWPTRWEAFGRPLRWVVDGSASLYVGDQRRTHGFDLAVKVGGGIEPDLGRQEIGAFGFSLQRLRVRGRYFFADRGVTGASIGIGISF